MQILRRGDMKLLVLTLALTLVSAGKGRMGSSGRQAAEFPAACDSEVYCLPGESNLLHTVQMARLYKDSKTFVDKPMKMSQEVVLSNFRKMMADTGGKPSNVTVREFVDANFLLEGTEFEDWTPGDWTEDPQFLNKIVDPDYLSFAKDIHLRWKDLGRKIKSQVRSSNTSSLIYLDKPFIVPGGRFREMYYWDSYWTILGLLQSEMHQTVKGMLENFVQLINMLGFIPNGNRLYYTRRTQPPLFTSMVEEYYKVTQDLTFLRQNIGAMEQEFKYWMANRTVDILMDKKTYKMAVYNVLVDGPRPESYFEDYRDAQSMGSEMVEFYMNMKSGAESGWDYSTKWFIGANAEVSQELTDNQCRHIVPVELNSYLCKNSRILMEFFEILGNSTRADYYRQIRDSLVEAIDTILWNDELGGWFDYDMLNEKQRLYFYISTVAPLWADCYPQTKLKEKVTPILKYLKQSQAFDYDGGVPTSTNPSGQQWDFPNGWPPLQELIVTGLENTGDAEAQDLALQVVKKWVKNNWLSYSQSGNSIFEKYDVTQLGLPGGGGEYDVQEGFGWTNGVLLSFFDKYGDKIHSDDDISNAGRFSFDWLHLVYLLFAVKLRNLMYS